MPTVNKQTSPTFPYLLLKHATKLFQKPWHLLDPESREKVRREAKEELAIQQAVLATEEAGGVTLVPAVAEQAVDVIRKRFPDEESFCNGLQDQGFDEAILRAALEDELLVEAILEKVGIGAEEPMEEEISAYYRAHQGRFHRPETRVARHLLITINSDFAQNTRAEALRRIEDIREELIAAPDQFADLAKRCSECPSALKGGELGTLSPGKLFHVLDLALFSLAVNEISPVLETEMGYHIMLCEQIFPATLIPLAEVAPQIKALLLRQKQQQGQKQWLRNLIARK